MKSAAAGIATVVMASALFAQVHIRESVDINPGFKSTGSIYDDTTRPVYLGIGGTVTVKLEQIFDRGVGLKRAGEEISGKKLVDASNPDLHPDSLVFENERQWTKLAFYVDIGLPGGSVVHLHPGYGGCDVIRDAYTHYLYFSVNPSTPTQYADVVLSLRLSPDYSLDAIPPSDIYDDIFYVSPFSPRDLVPPTGGEAFLTIDAANPTNQGDDLYMELPFQTHIVSNAPARVGDTIALGRVQCGEPLRLYLRSGKAVVAGSNLYPEISQQGNIPFLLTDGSKGTIPVFLPDGREAQIVGTMWFDDWTDLIYDKLICTVYVISDTSNVFVQIEPSEVAPGDTATITVRKHENCGLTDYPQEQLFNVGISSGDSHGTILSSDGTDTARYFTGIPEGFKFIAADSIEGDSTIVEITVGLPAEEGEPCAIAPGGKGVDDKVAASQDRSVGSNARTSLLPNGSAAMSLSVGKSSLQAGRKMVSSEDDFTSSEYGIVRAPVKKRTILLGETMYYQAIKDPQSDDRIKFKEFERTSEAGAQEFSSVDFKVDIKEGNKLGVYWEKKDEQGDDLRRDIIRLVGRYWEKDKLYKIKLNASAEGRYGSIDIEVRKPARLGNSNCSATDVFGKTLNLDELIIKYAGEYGIPPQLIKGQMQQESASFTPAWRYEPFQDMEIQNGEDPDRYFAVNLPFVADETTMGSGDKPKHSNEDPLPYPDVPTKIARFTVDHWDNYVQRHNGDKPDIIVGDSSLSKRWFELYSEIKKDKSKAIDDAIARTQAHNELKKEIEDETSEIGEAFDLIAQTRKVTSYGFTQMMYITAADNVFNNNHDQCYNPSKTYYVDQTDVHTYPEKLNEQDFLMPCYCDFLWKNLNFTFVTCIPEGNWQGGFEGRWDQTLVRYNGAPDYGEKVLANAENYLPSK